LQNPNPVKSSFPPVTDARTRVLVLGSLPGEVSLAQAQYYANPRNQFWRLMEDVTGLALVGLDYDARLLALKSARVGLWDVIQSAERSGSLDAAIRAHRPNALAAFTATLPDLRAVAFNGAKAAEIGRKALAGGRFGGELITLPSSSPAHAVPFESKRAPWLRLRDYLAD
jgi:TDG/mug DNA glycosylase family protein